MFEENGCPAAPDHDRRTDFHFNALLDAVAEWKLERLNLAKAKNVDKDSEKGENCNRLGKSCILLVVDVLVVVVDVLIVVVDVMIVVVVVLIVVDVPIVVVDVVNIS